MTILNKKLTSSSVIKRVVYDTKLSALAVQFNSESIWVYLDVPIEVYDELINAHSAGNYFNKHIRNVYESEQYMTASEWTSFKENSTHG